MITTFTQRDEMQFYLWCKFMIRIIVPWDGMELNFLIMVDDRKH